MSAPPDFDAELSVDFLVIGGGMAGISAAAYAAQQGASVIVVEKAPEIGGSAVLSGGGLWTLADPTRAADLDPDGAPELAKCLANEYAAATDWVERLGTEIQSSARIDSIMGFPAVVRPFDVFGHIQRCAAEVRNADGWVATNATVERLTMAEGRVTGALVRDRDGLTLISAPWTLLATGGFGGDRAMRSSLIGPHAADVVLRANPHSTGGGISLALDIGATLRPLTPTFYGHLLATPRRRPLEPRDYLRLAQIASPKTVLLDKDGNRFVDESKAYYANASAVSRLPNQRALMVTDEAQRQSDLTAYPGAEQIDRFADAAAEGAPCRVGEDFRRSGKRCSALGVLQCCSCPQFISARHG